MCAALSVILVSGFSIAGETLYNGIVLPDAWPPRRTMAELRSGEVMKVPYLQQRPDVIPIDVGRQLLVDDFLIEQTTLTRRFHKAELYGKNPVLRPDRRWEMIYPTKVALAFSDGVFYDPKDRLFKAWYMSALFGDTAYATSANGLEWTKPSLDVRPPTNVVLLSGQRDSSTVWLDLQTSDPQQRFKLFQFNRDNWRGSVHTSPDGIHWTEPRWTGPCGDRSTVFYNPFRKVWVYSIRCEANKGPWNYKTPPYNPVIRARRYWECRDFLAGAAWTGGPAMHEEWKSGEPVPVMLRAAAQAMVDSGLIQHGWQYVNIDDGWHYGKHFFEAQDARQWAEWGFDYAKYDWGVDSIEVTRRMTNALAACDRDIVLELSNSVPLAQAAQYTRLAQLSRTTGDLVDLWDRSQMDAGLRRWAVGIREVWLAHDAWAPHQRPGHWNHACNLRIGLLGGWRNQPLTPSRLTADEQYAHISLWCLWGSPMIIGTPIERLDPFTLSLLSNDEVLQVNQDPLGKQARPVKAAGGEALAKELEDGSKAVGLLNPGSELAKVSIDWSTLGLKGTQHVRNLWRQKDLGIHTERFTAEVRPHGVVLVGVTQAADIARGEAPTLSVPAAHFSRGDVTEGKDAHGSYLVVNSVVEYELEGAGVRQLTLEAKVAGDSSLATYVNGKLHQSPALSTSRTSLGLNNVPRWVAVDQPIDVPPEAKRIAVVLRHDVRGGHRCPPRRVYELRFTTRRGAGAAKLKSAERKPWDYYAWLLERYPLSERVQESPHLRPREPFQFDRTLPEHPTDYPDAIASEEVGYQAGNALLRHGEVQRSRLEPALGRRLQRLAGGPDHAFRRKARRAGSHRILQSARPLVAGLGDLAWPDGLLLSSRAGRQRERPDEDRGERATDRIPDRAGAGHTERAGDALEAGVPGRTDPQGVAGTASVAGLGGRALPPGAARFLRADRAAVFLLRPPAHGDLLLRPLRGPLARGGHPLRALHASLPDVLEDRLWRAGALAGERGERRLVPGLAERPVAGRAGDPQGLGASGQRPARPGRAAPQGRRAEHGSRGADRVRIHQVLRGCRLRRPHPEDHSQDGRSSSASSV
jgi:hypothetical protein